MSAFELSLSNSSLVQIGREETKIVEVSEVFKQPNAVISTAAEQRYAHINPHYPGLRAQVESALLSALCETVSRLAAANLGRPKMNWVGQAWYSIVTTPKERLTPIQRLPHFDGFDENQLAVMIYLNRTAHGGTGFYRHLETGFECVTEPRYPTYKTALERGVQKTGLPPAQYIEDGAPHFEKLTELGGAFNSLILYPGVSLHSGVINNAEPLPSDPLRGRLTINGFFRPVP
ncbi:MAG: DUF6445 family protein [Henriciella sp.]